MTITFTDSEWEKFTGDLGKWRYERELAMEKVLLGHFSKEKVHEIYSMWRERIRDKELPTVAGMKILL